MPATTRSALPDCGLITCISTKSRLDRKQLPFAFGDFVEPWLTRALAARERQEAFWAFEAFIFLWVTFNAWLSAAVADRNQTENDRYLVETAGVDPQLCTAFEGLKCADGKDVVERFRSLWPVFKVRALMKHRIEPWEEHREARDTYRERCIARGITCREYAPRCFANHQHDPTHPDPALVPLDWAHTMSAIYQMRCNLFHGGKSFAHSSDYRLVEMSFDILWKVWGEQTLCNPWH